MQYPLLVLIVFLGITDVIIVSNKTLDTLPPITISEPMFGIGLSKLSTSIKFDDKITS